jgi:hypothetical protein
MEKNYSLRQGYDVESLNEHIVNLKINGFIGIAAEPDCVTVYFNESKTKLTVAEQKKLDELLLDYKDIPGLVKVRKAREPLLAEADWRLLKAQDDQDSELELKIREYRKQLRDATLQSPVDLVWPEKPWG